jgi:tetraacyldisaccharide 4'-kinase
MNFNAIFLKSFRVLLLPFALLYGLIVIVRNFLYDRKWLRSSEFNFPLICVGNLSVGGTGKSPMVEYLIQLLRPHFKIATVSRGYKRKTKGYVLAKENSTALDIGDEPMQFHVNFPDITVAVGEERLVAIPQLLHDRPDTQAVILDDAFQHREVRAGLNILLTQYDDLFTNDFFLPTGDLRDQRSSYKRADIIIITKCPMTLDETERKEIVNEIEPQAHQKIFFTAIEYGVPYHISNNSFRKITHEDEVLLVCGIANPKPLKEYLFDTAATYYQMDYNDHHIFRIDDLKDMRKKYDHIDADRKMIITTEKDAVRLIKFTDELHDMHLYVLPIRHRFLFNAGTEFDEIVVKFIREFKMREELIG